MIENALFENMLDWSAQVEIAPGRFEVIADANSAFWAEWKRSEAAKSEIRALGIRVKPGTGRQWIVTWTRNEPFVQVSHEQDDVEASGQEFSTRAAALPDFVAPPVDSSIPWTDEQQAIFKLAREHKGHVVIRARAGTGKTTVSKAAFTQFSEKQIGYLVFGKRNQLEAQAKITDARVSVSTLHSLGLKFIKRVWRNARMDKDTGSVETDRVRQLFGDNLPDEVFGALLKLVGFVKNTCVNPTLAQVIETAERYDVDAEEYEKECAGGWTIEKLSASVLRLLDLATRPDALGRVSGNDMVWLPVRMGWVRPVFDAVLVDEAQDMNLPQLLMAMGASRGRVFIVGDDCQAIYGFRGAAQNGIDMMKSKLNAIEVGLTITQRCPKAIVREVTGIVPDYKAADNAPEGSVTSMMIEPAMASVKVGDVILSRANAPLMPLCLQLLRKGIAARIEGRDIGKLLVGKVEKLKANSIPDFLRKVVTNKARRIVRAQARKATDSDIAAIEDEAETLIALADGVKSISALKERIISLFQDSDKCPKPAVVLSSVHKAKGLEWNKVFMIRSTFLKKGRESQEEKFLFYVACTRSKNELVYVVEEN